MQVAGSVGFYWQGLLLVKTHLITGKQRCPMAARESWKYSRVCSSAWLSKICRQKQPVYRTTWWSHRQLKFSFTSGILGAMNWNVRVRDTKPEIWWNQTMKIHRRKGRPISPPNQNGDNAVNTIQIPVALKNQSYKQTQPIWLRNEKENSWRTKLQI